MQFTLQKIVEPDSIFVKVLFDISTPLHLAIHATKI